ncbi:MAG: glycosyltransferase [Alphaproteobacteria bacterium]|nr:glycosyltransferase [Alphaproteobacteria bacterium SS10]
MTHPIRRAVTQNYKIDDPTVWPTGFKKWTPLVLYQIFLFFSLVFIGSAVIPNTLWDPETQAITFTLGILGVWRYGWWMTHAVRARNYGRHVYPRLKAEGEQLWRDGWRPRHLHFMFTTFKEHRDITEKVVRSIIREVRDAGVPGTIWLGSGDIYDEEIIADLIRRETTDIDFELKIVRQNVPGKRAAIGLVLRAMNRGNVEPDDLIIFMDGDFILGQGCIGKCMPLFRLYPDLQAVTTDEEVICIGPKWIASWLTMRFAQRRLAMQSHALSNRVLTLTGRMSVFRANHLMQLEFIRVLEADHLDHWLWGKFRFLSGDDKSTWYYLLKHRSRMLYVPDALGYTVEVIEGGGMDRMVQNFRRWSGNMLRNGMRAIQLGPRAMPFFIWWCLIDQRLSMWTMLVSPALALSASLLVSPYYMVSYVLFILFSRMMLSLVLFTYSRKIDITYPFILYLNQLINASVKVYCIWRLSKQRWSNRGNQSAGFDGGTFIDQFRNGMAKYLTALSVTMLFIGVIWYSKLVHMPSAHIVGTLLR